MIVLRRDGSLDQHFAGNGVLRFPEDEGPYFAPEEFGDGVAVDRKGRILFVGFGGVRRLLPNGRLDRSFGSRGTAPITFGKPGADPISVAVLPDGKIVVGGAAEFSKGSANPALARLTERGNPDPSFGVKGNKILAGSYSGDRPRVVHVAVGPKGEVFAVIGNYPLGPAIQRVGPRGGVVRSFGREGIVEVGVEGPGDSDLFAVPKIGVTPDGKLVVGSSVQLRGERGDAMVAFRYLPNGRPDPSFGGEGHVVLATRLRASTWAVAVRPNGGIVLSGDGGDERAGYFLLAALRPNGSRDLTVGPRGFARARVDPYIEAPALVLQGDAAIAIGYMTDADSEVSRTLLARFHLSL